MTDAPPPEASRSPDDFVGAARSAPLAPATSTVARAGGYGYYGPAHGGPSGLGRAGAILVEP